MTQDHNLAKPNHTKPNQDILGPFIGLFDPFLGQKYQKPIVNDFNDYSPLKYIYVRYIFHGSRFWGNSLDLAMLLTTCEMSVATTEIYKCAQHSVRHIIQHCVKYITS